MYKLEIYTWPACRGIDPKIRRSFHDSVFEARLHVGAQTERWSLATLQSCIDEHSSSYPFGWNGKNSNTDWVLEGDMLEHPDFLRYEADKYTIAAIVAEEYKKTKKGTIYIAPVVLKTLGYNGAGWSEEIARIAATMVR